MSLYLVCKPTGVIEIAAQTCADCLWAIKGEMKP
jgi:hypothetical protein